MIDKKKLTKHFLSQLSLPIDTKNVRKHILIWWMNSRSAKNNGLRLTEAGYKNLTERLEISKYEIEIPPDTEWTSQLLLHLDKFLESPYYIQKRSIVVFREKIAVELILFEGNIRKYGLAKERSQKNNTTSH
jgi:hypothetical protein